MCLSGLKYSLHLEICRETQFVDYFFFRMTICAQDSTWCHSAFEQTLQELIWSSSEHTYPSGTSMFLKINDFFAFQDNNSLFSKFIEFRTLFAFVHK